MFTGQALQRSIKLFRVLLFNCLLFFLPLTILSLFTLISEMHCLTRASKSTPTTPLQLSPPFEYLILLLHILVTFSSVRPLGVGQEGAVKLRIGGLYGGISS